MEEKEFGIRLAKLRMKKGVSAREMSISMGQNPGYINNIENGKALPSVSSFFAICRFLEITPQDFFDEGNKNPGGGKTQEIAEALKRLDEDQLHHIGAIVEALAQEH